MSEPRRRRVGRVVRPHGLRGEVRVVADGVLAQAMARCHTVWLVGPWGEEVRQVASVRQAAGALLVKLQGVDDRTQAERLRGAMVYVSEDQLPPLPEGTYYVSDLLGAEVVTEGGEFLGTLADVLHGPAHDVYVVRGPRGEVLLPAVEEVVREVRVQDRRITVRLLPGLVEEE